MLQRSLPHGLLHWRYLCPGRNERIRLHRHFWWQGKPDHRSRVLWLAIEIVFWLRWVLVSGWVACARTWWLLHRTCPASSIRQIGALLRWSIAWCIPPARVYRFGLFDGQSALDYVFDHEAAAYHRWRSGPGSELASSLALLQDKQACKERLVRAGIECPQGSVVARHSPVPFRRARAGLNRCFCKQRHGNQGRHAFAAWREHGQWQGIGFDGGGLADEAALEQAWQALMASDDALVEPLLANHPALAALSPLDDAITVRLISERGGRISCAWLEVPWRESASPTRYHLHPLDLESGAPWREALASNLASLSAEIGPLPFWPELVRASLAAHQCFPGLHAIAWDWVLTPSGPVLLEGNSGWGTLVPQLLRGPLLSSL